MRSRVKTQPISHLRKRFNVYDELIWSHYGTAVMMVAAIAGIRISFAVAHSGASPVSTIIYWIVLPICASIALGIYTVRETASRMKRSGL